MTEKETYAEKIAKLLRKAESTTSPEEAELFFAKAQELMAKYAIDEAMIAAAKGDKTSDSIVTEEFVLTGSYRVALGNLTYSVITQNGLKAILLRDPGWRKIGDKVYKQCYVLEVTGFKKDMDRVRTLDASLQIQAASAMSRWWNENKTLYGDRDGFLARRQFLFSFANAVHKKLAEAVLAARRSADQEHGSESVALVLRDKSLMVQDAFEKKYPALKTVKQRQTAGSAWAAAAGHEAGQRADLSTGNNLGGSRKGIGQ